ncbi:MAG: CinA family nicotinamide mononucleotide deamidase-related protein [Desulfobacteraceae bacterium]|nr:CinA family nicotinamide mononucleotide deamidase-related protein [Desulfobacteraceae bacterium]
MEAEIIATGDEIRTGALVDSNSAHIALALEAEGVTITRHHAVGDDGEVLAGLFREVSGRADLAVVTGGLGPTVDDRSAEAAALAGGVSLRMDNVALRSIEAFFEKRGREMSPSNRKQAMLPEGSRRMDNPVGTAPGFSMSISRCRFFYLPGVPSEMRRMLREQVLPEIRSLQGEDRPVHRVLTLSTFGLPESVVGDRLNDLPTRFPELQLGLRAHFPSIQVRLYASGRDEANLESTLKAASEWVARRLDPIRVVSFVGEDLETVVGRLLREQGATLAVAESCTGGEIAHRITNVPGSSDFFLLSAVTYANSAKTEWLGVAPETIEAFGAVSEQTAKAMAKGVRERTGADFGVSTSGIAGPTGGSEEKPVGTVCIGIASPDRIKGYRYVFPFGRRRMNKTIFAASALDLLRRELMKRNE